MFFAQHQMRRVIAPLAFAALLTLAASEARAVPMYTIRDLGTLPDKSNSVATSINNQGQVVGISYNDADGKFYVPSQGPGYSQSGTGTQSFLYDNGKTTRIDPTGGPALSINDHGQVVGGEFVSINNVGQYVASPGVGVGSSNSGPAEIYDNGVRQNVVMTVAPYAINDSGVVVGAMMTGSLGREMHPAMFRDGQTIDLMNATLRYPGLSWTGPPLLPHGVAIGINNKNDILAVVWSVNTPAIPGVPPTTVIFNPTTGEWKNLSKVPGYEGGQGVALNNLGQVVGNDFLYDGSTIRKLTELLPPTSGWSGLHPTDINDSGWIVGQGMIDGKLHAFLMTPEDAQVPEPSTVLIWGVLAALGVGSRRVVARKA
ncbi:hypothetical protein [Paludisphaera borealis]|uniref:PEP-CTERM protein-sorting domain-containing protein n=1 Tax=Paludisphaera borealis TaxID=1387353 RepID=A0A1U7CXY0_9BACT|nr:hypothetical protein [Paludisphaera borealis]APW63743.1 hypothetical protein BSF38_05319 [Paludisphaera borealis]